MPPAESRIAVRRALISVYDKTGLDTLVVGLAEAGVELVSSGGTATFIAALGLPVTNVSDVTGFPEILDGRVKTLHPRVHAGLLADTHNPAHVATLAEHEHRAVPARRLEPLPVPRHGGLGRDARGDDRADRHRRAEHGPRRLRRTTAASRSSSTRPTTRPFSRRSPRAVSTSPRAAASRPARSPTPRRTTPPSRTGAATTLDPDSEGWPPYAGVALERAEILRYGENPHQHAALYVDHDVPPGLAQAVQLHGKAMSYNNYVDTDAARRAAYDHPEPCVAIIKHANPCGIAIGADVADAHRKAHACDPVSAFGGVIAVNRPVSEAMAEQVAEIFTEVIVAPGYEDGAVEVLSRKPSIRILTCADPTPAPVEVRQITGGMLVQTVDRLDAPGDDPLTWTLQTGTPLDAAAFADLAFAWRAVRATKSNAILLAHDGATVGVGMGQVNRVDAARLAVSRAGDRARGSVAASDAFFPFPDGLEVLAEAGVRAVVEPGGSVRDEEVVAAAEKAGVVVYFSGTRHFFH